MDFHILTLFPDMVLHGLGESVIGRAIERGTITVEAVDIRDYTADKHKKVDDYPYGGGAGMLMQAQPVYDAWRSVRDRVGEDVPMRTIYVTPQGRRFDQRLAEELAGSSDLVFLCGHYEGIDERVLGEIVTDYVSIGDYVLTGGELPAMVMVDAIARLVPGVLNNEESAGTESFHGSLLEYPQYTRPAVWNGIPVPPVLLSGNQREIAAWRREESKRRTRERRPDLYEEYRALADCGQLLQKHRLHYIAMLELIARGQAKLVGAEGETILLKDSGREAYFLAADSPQEGCRMLLAHRERFRQGQSDVSMAGTTLMVFDAVLAEEAAALLGMQQMEPVVPVVYTRKEKLPVRGLYRTDGTGGDGLLAIRRFSADEGALLRAHCVGQGEAFLAGLKRGAVYAAFAGEAPVGFAVQSDEGAVQLPYVLPACRGGNAAKALLTFLFNAQLEHERTPYAELAEQQREEAKLLGSLGLCTARGKAYRLWAQ